MNFVIACGGTGGHIYPGIAAAERLRARFPGCGILFVGSQGNMETELVPREGWDIRTIRAYSFHRSVKPADIWHNVRGVIGNVAAIGRSRIIINEYKPSCVIGTGGYVCYPVLRAAVSLGVPAVIHESNAGPGLTTRLLEPYVDKILIGFEESLGCYKRREKVEVVGMPVRSGFVPRERVKRGGRLPRLLSLWGSLGASRMNDLTAQIIAMNEKEGAFSHTHVTGGGEQGVERMRARLEELGVVGLKYTRLCPYIYNMAETMADCDMAMCRSGASTLGELSAMGIPALLIPSVNVTANQQEKNARVPEGRGGAVVLTEDVCTAEKMFDTIKSVIRDESRLRTMSEAMSSLYRPDAADRIAFAAAELSV
ncbi:MAG: UDP-N-acetylglucosamine--N-acetylmuramyl-(pentapeptide) pyrophosphoryl-undecaprenol N-acetylglucosamine transferase [Clostridiales bacterium]|nr:UDP-N-acetylglucosamine--N-acetylmuramyl-(pentapeptide) pyrophosphoryl-undecaprenol N-acetylglucosamine transferase [Clostridiales bacterium]